MPLGHERKPTSATPFHYAAVVGLSLGCQVVRLSGTEQYCVSVACIDWTGIAGRIRDRPPRLCRSRPVNADGLIGQIAESRHASASNPPGAGYAAGYGCNGSHAVGTRPLSDTAGRPQGLFDLRSRVAACLLDL